MKPQPPPDPGRVQGWAYQRRHAEPRVQRHIPRYMAMRPGERQRPDSLMENAAIIAWAMVVLLWIAAMTGGLHA